MTPAVVGIERATCAQPRVLLVDDEMPNLSTFRRVYRKHYNITLAQSGAAGLELLASNVFDVILSDFSMPVMSGAEFVVHARHVQSVAIVMVTGYMNHPAVVDLETSGAIFATVSKPWDRQMISDVIARAVARTRELRGAPSSAVSG